MEAQDAQHALALFNAGPEGRKQLADRPDLMDLLLEIHRAQMGQHKTMDDLRYELHANYPGEDEGNEE